MKEKSAKPDARNARTRYKNQNFQPYGLSQCVNVKVLYGLLSATMTSRRIISSDQDLLNKDKKINNPNASEASIITPAVPT